MSRALVLFLPTPTVPWRWLRIVGDGVTARGEGFPTIGEDVGARVAIAPADAVTLHWAELPDRSLAQSLAAARLLAADASTMPIGALHVAVGREGEGVERPIGVVAANQMQGWLDLLSAEGVDPDSLLPAPMLLPRPESGYLRGAFGGEGVVRGATSGFADEAGLTELITGGVVPLALDREALEVAIVAAIVAPPLDLLQGPFARKSRVGVDWALVRRLGWLTAGVLAVTVLIALVQLLRYSTAADDLERRSDLLARTGLARGEAVSDADRQLGARLDRLRGGGLGFSRTSAAVFAAIRATPGTELRTLSFDPEGTLRVTLAAQTEGQIVDLEHRIAANGLVAIPAGQFQSAAGRLSGDLLGEAAMTQRLLLWFRGRTQREQYLVLLGAAMTVLALGYFLVVPLGDALDSAKARHADAVIALGETQARVDAIKTATAGRIAPLDTPLDTLIRARADAAGFTLTSVVPQGNDRLQLAIASARPGALVGWLAELEASGVLVDRLTTTDNNDHTIAVQLTVKARGQ